MVKLQQPETILPILYILSNFKPLPTRVPIRVPHPQSDPSV